MSDELEKLAAEGRARKAAGEQRKLERETDDERARRRELQSVLWSSVSTFARWAWVPAAVPLGALLALATARLLPAKWFPEEGSTEEGGLGGLLVMVTFASAFLLTRALRGGFGRRAVVREQRWAALLPFKLEGYLETLGGRASDGKLELALQYVGAAPADLEFVSDVLRVAGLTVTATPTSRVHRATAQFSWEESVSTNHHVADFIHRAMPTLRALHEKWPLEQVTVSADWQG